MGLEEMLEGLSGRRGKRIEAFKVGDDVKIVCTCPECGEQNEIMVKLDDFKKWEGGELVQRAFPYLNNDQREQIITGIDQKCWNRIFAGGDDE